MFKSLSAALLLVFCLVLASCGGSSSSTKTISPSPDFTLTSTPATLTLTPGGAAQQVSVMATAENGFTGAVSVAITGLPTGVTANPATLNLIPGTAQTVSITASSSAAAGSATITLTGTSGSLTHTSNVAATIAAAPQDFSLSASPTTITLTAGASGAQVSVLATAVNSFSSPVAVAITGLPAGVTASPATLTLTAGTAQTVTITAAATAAAGSATLTFTGTSGSLAHTATVAATITAAATAADFTLSASPATIAITGGAAGAAVNVLATPLNGFTGPVAVAITGLPAGVTASPATLTLAPGTAQTVTIAAGTTATTGSATLTFTGTSGSLSHTATVGAAITAATLTAAPDVTTYHYDNARDGLNAQETILTPTNVNSTQFGKIGAYFVDGLVDGEPLYLANVTTGGALHNVLYVVTEHDSVFALDADTGAKLWMTSVVGAGETPSDDRGCGNISPEIGITSTPVIDRKQGPNGTIFVVGMTKDAAGGYHQRLHALDVTTGAEIAGSPTEIAATYPGTGANSTNGTVVFDPAQYAERASLLLVNGSIYLTWTSHCDHDPYTGWVMAYSETTLKQTAVLDVTPNGIEGAIWMSGGGPAADSSGNIYFLDGDGTFDPILNANGQPTSGDYGNAMLKLSTTGGTLAVADYFETFDTVAESALDQDLGSGGAVLLPPQTDSSGVVHNLVVGGGKQNRVVGYPTVTKVFVADTSHLGGFNPTDLVYQVLAGVVDGGIFSTPAYFNGTLYFGGVGDNLKAIPVQNAMLATTPSSQSTATFGYPGSTPAVSANGTTNGIVWALESTPNTLAVLHAFDATNLGNELYNSNQAANGRDGFGNGNKFITPLVVNGKVYIGTTDGVAVFGLLPQ